jgi:hypothetical protein
MDLRTRSCRWRSDLDRDRLTAGGRGKRHVTVPPITAARASGLVPTSRLACRRLPPARQPPPVDGSAVANLTKLAADVIELKLEARDGFSQWGGRRPLHRVTVHRTFTEGGGNDLDTTEAVLEAVTFKPTGNCVLGHPTSSALAGGGKGYVASR